MTTFAVQTPNPFEFAFATAEAEREALREPTEAPTAPTPEPGAMPDIVPSEPLLTPEEFAAKTAVLRIGRTGPTFRAGMKSSEIIAPTDEADPLMFAVTKRLLDKKVMAAIRSADRRITDFIMSKAAPCSLMGPGNHVVRLESVNEVDAAIDAYQVNRAALVKTLLYGASEAQPERTNYEVAVEQAKVRLKEHFRAEEYPAPEAVERAFSITARWMTFNVPAAFEAQNKAIYEREVRNITADLQDAGAEARLALRTMMADVVDGLAERLGSDPVTGKPLTFHDSTVEKLLGFVNSVSSRDITGDTDLMALATQARNLLNGVPADRLRSDGAARTRVLVGMENIKATLKTMDVVPKRARKIRTAGEV